MSKHRCKYKIGDRVKTLYHPRGSSKYADREAVIYRIDETDSYSLKLRFDDGDTCSWMDEGDLIIINKGTMNMKEKFALLLTKEPFKTFRKTGLTNGDGYLTDEGQEVFLSWLLNKNAADFKKEVADDLLELTEEK